MPDKSMAPAPVKRRPDPSEVATALAPRSPRSSLAPEPALAPVPPELLEHVRWPVRGPLQIGDEVRSTHPYGSEGKIVGLGGFERPGWVRVQGPSYDIPFWVEEKLLEKL